MPTIPELERQLALLTRKYNALLAACQPIVKACEHDDLLADREHATIRANYWLIVVDEDYDVLTTEHLYAIADQIAEDAG